MNLIPFSGKLAKTKKQSWKHLSLICLLFLSHSFVLEPLYSRSHGILIFDFASSLKLLS
jgi:hypothetical protein